MKGAPTMENAQNTNLEALREMIGALVAECTDENLLDLIGKLLLPLNP